MMNQKTSPLDFLDNYILYTEKETNLLYEVRLFEDYAMVRPASPTFYGAIQKMDINDLNRDFEEFSGSYDDIKKMYRRPIVIEDDDYDYCE